MKAKSIEYSLYEEILALGDQFQALSDSSLLNQDLSIHISSDAVNSIAGNPISHKFKHQPITNLQDHIFQLQIKAQQKAQREKVSKRNKLHTELSKNKSSQPLELKSSSSDVSLYQKCLQEQNHKRYEVEKKVKEKEKRQLSQCTHTPEINANSYAIMEKLDKESITLRKREKRQSLIKSRLEEQENKMLSECSFQPKINKKYKPKQDRNNVFDALYKQSKARDEKLKTKQQQFMEQCIKSPKIDNISKDITNETTFEERQSRYEKQKQIKYTRRKLQQQKQEQVLHRPKINKFQQNRNTKQLPIGQYLYKQSRKKTEKEKKKQHKSFTNGKSQKFYEDKKTTTFYRIFMLLDDDEDGIISITNINLSALPRQIIKILYPLLEELQVMEVELTENEFIESISRLFKTLSIHEKNTLFSINGRQKKTQNYAFKPKINLKSQQIANEIQRSQLSIYDYCSIRESEKQKQLETERVEQCKKEMKECTFQPKIISSFQYY